MKILLVGGGGREHALAWKLQQSKQCEKLYCAPGNAGIEEAAECVDLAADDIGGLVSFAKEEAVDLVVVGPEVPLVAGLTDEMQKQGIAVFGPSKAAARLEGSKSFMKDICTKAGVRTARYQRFTAFKAAENYIKEQAFPLVIKADGLAAGKGVIIAQNETEALSAARDMLSGEAFGGAGEEIVIEEFLHGIEISFFALCDGKDFVSFGSAQDYKRVGDGDTGPNTGGMGTISPAPAMKASLVPVIEKEIIAPVLAALKDAGCPFTGVLFAGLMLVDGEPVVLEFNARFGDPECQSLMRRFDGDLVKLLAACAQGDVGKVKDRIGFKDEAAVTIVMATKGYPGAYSKNTQIIDLEKAASLSDVKIFHAGTVRGEGGMLLSAGGRVLGVSATGQTQDEARRRAYEAVDLVEWSEGFCRRDIGA